LLAKLLGNAALFPKCRLVVEDVFILTGAQGLPKLVTWGDMHADKQPAALAIASGPPINMSSKVSPAAKVEVPDTEIGALGDLERLLKRRQ
jgi:hypothetical protein